MTGAFLPTLLAAGRPVIMEVKRRGADGTDLLGDRSIGDVVADYEAAGAACISVVTGRWFGGTPGMLAEVAALTDRPVLWKDFVTSRRHLLAGVEAGASAVLLTAAVLPEVTLHSLIEGCLGLGLTPFVEVASAAECARVRRAAECVVAVNNKDIADRERGPGDTGRSLALLPDVVAGGTLCPVSASGIDRPEVAARLLAAGYAGLLVGTGLLRSGSATAWADELDRHRRALAGGPVAEPA